MVTERGFSETDDVGPAVWEPFLTEQDRQLATMHSRDPSGLGIRPALILIDLYKRVFGDRPIPVLEAVKEWPSSCGLSAWKALPHIERLLATARDVGVPVVHVTGDAQMPPWRTPRGAGGVGYKAEDFAIVEQVAPIEGEVVIRKSSPSAFFGTPLEGLLRQWRVDGLIVVGESTSGCVRASVVDGRSHRFAVTVAEDGVFDRTEATHAINLFDMAQKYADVRPVDDVIAELLSETHSSSGS